MTSLCGPLAPFLVMLGVLSSSMPAQTLPSTGIDFAAVDAFWQIVDVLSKDHDPSEAQWQALLATPGYQFAQIAVGDVIREDLQLAFSPSRRVEFDTLTKLPNDRASRLTHLQRAATLRSQLVAFQDSLGRSDLIHQAIATAARFLPAGATNTADPPLVAFALFRYDGYAVRTGIVVDLLKAYESNLVLFLAHEFHHTYLHLATGTFVPSAPGHTALREALEQLRSEGIADLIDKPHPLLATNPQVATYVQRYNDEYAKTPIVLRELDSILGATMMDSAQIRSAGQRVRRLLWNSGHAQGAYMARQILTTFGTDSLFPGIINPAAFLRTFATSEKLLGHPEPWSPETMKMIEALERRYWHQEPLVHHSLDSGTVVRLHPFSGPPEAGRLMAPFDADSVRLRYCLYYARPCRSAADATWRERVVSDIAQLDIKTGSHPWRGFAIGTAGCGLAWALVSPVAGWPDWTDNPANLLLDFVGGAVLFAPTCGGVGAMIGAQSPRWGSP